MLRILAIPDEDSPLLPVTYIDREAYDLFSPAFEPPDPAPAQPEVSDTETRGDLAA